MVVNLCEIFIVSLILRCANSVSDTKSNVAFVIDDTASMGPVIEQVKERAEQIFKAIYSSKTSLIGDFILVTFNDYEEYYKGTYYDNFTREVIKVRAITSDPVEFLNKLNEINVNGGGECPELCYAGIKSALEKCNPNSFVYVFTDASPRDYELQKTVEALAQQKSIQVTFLLAVDGDCSVDEAEYKKLATATSGEVFLLKQNDIHEIIDYIIHCMQSSQTPLLTVPIKPGSTNIKFTADKDMKNLSIKVNVQPEAYVGVGVTGPEGKKTATDNLVNTSNTKVVVITNPRGGPYTATVDTNGSGETSIKAAISIDFKHGFSTWKPTSMKDTKTRPIPDEDSYLTIQLILTGNIDAELKNIQILDIDDKELMSISANVIDEKEKIYVTSIFKPPQNTFKIAIIAFDPKTGDVFKRISRTPVQPQTLPIGNLSYKRPEVTIDNSPKINVKYGEPIILACKVKAYPKPNIIWEDKVTGSELLSKVSIVELPDEYISHLEIDHVNKAGSYKCKVTSSRNEVITSSIEVETYRPRFFNIIESPKDTKIDYEKKSKVHCKIDAWPPAHISWYKDDKELMNDEHFDISNEKTNLLVKNMQLELEGSYSCKATNDDNSVTLDFTLNLAGVESPEFDKMTSTNTVNDGSKAYISCSLMKGSPSPVITWEFKKHDDNKFVKLVNTEQRIEIDPVKMDNAGIYKCHAKNIIGEDNHEIALIVQCFPKIDKTISKVVANRNTQITISCRIMNGIPVPDISWEFKQKGTTDFLNIAETKDNHIIQPVDIENDGVYRCHAKNIVGEDVHDTELIIQYLPEIDKAVSSKSVTEGSNIDIQCSIIRAFPTPEITWTFKEKDTNIFKILTEKDTFIHIDDVALQNAGVYKCLATNVVGEDSFEFLLNVNSLPQIDHSQSTVIVKRGSKAIVTCRITKGVPEPKITWKFRKNGETDFDSIPEIGQEINIESTDLNDAGVYGCVAKNIVGEDTHETELIVQHSPTIDKSMKTKSATKGARTVIECRILRGFPQPLITWEFKREKAIEFISLPITVTEINIDPVKVDDSGVYKCTVKNIVGEDTHEIVFTVNNLPTATVNQPLTAKFGETVTLTCEVVGEPKPDVIWIRNGKTIVANEKYKIYSDNSLRFIASEDDGGNYTCDANNSIGKDSKNATLNVYGPIKIEPPVESPLNIDIGSDMEVMCKASGIPMPVITWTFFSLDPNVGTKVISSADHMLKIDKVQANNAGFYICAANNGYDEKNITYEVLVNVPVEIEYPLQKEFTIVEDDFVLMIPCKAKGYPKPKVSWTKNFVVLSMGSSYGTDSEGSLIIKDPDKSAAGKYLCVAENEKSAAFQMFTVKFSPIPTPSESTDIVYVEENTSTEIECKLPHKSTDVIRWYTNGKLLPLPTNQFILHHALISDSGDYTCRVSSFKGSDSAHLTLEVGTKPLFTNERNSEITIPFIQGRKSMLDCDAKGNPTPKITWWHNGVELDQSVSIFSIDELNDSHIGQYRCEANNHFGTITRTYVLKITGCPINYTENEANKFHPVLITRRGKLDEFENQDGVMITPENEPVDFLCPNYIRKVYCSKNEYISIDNTKPAEERRLKYADLKCDREVELTVGQYSLVDQACSNDRESRLIQIGYEYGGSFYGVYDVCINKKTRKLFFIKYDVTRFASNIKIDIHPSGAVTDQYMFYDIMDTLNCYKQTDAVTGGCCFLGRQLLSPQDVSPGLQKTTYLNINVVPHWNYCGANLNLNEVERRIRDLARSIRYKLSVFSGEFQDQNTDLIDHYGQPKIAPKYLWKVVQIRPIGQALAIVTINVPNLTAEEAKNLVFCMDICEYTDWMQNTEWHNVLNGYTFCCESWDFAGKINPLFIRLFQYDSILRKSDLK